jgi:hypothetical protein
VQPDALHNIIRETAGRIPFHKISEKVSADIAITTYCDMNMGKKVHNGLSKEKSWAQNNSNLTWKQAWIKKASILCWLYL